MHFSIRSRHGVPGVEDSRVYQGRGGQAGGIASLINAGTNAITGLTQGTPGSVVPTNVRSESESTATTETTGVSSIEELMSQLQQLTEAVTQQTAQQTQQEQQQATTGTVTQQNLSASQEAVLNDILAQTQQMFGAESPYSRERAVEASQAARQAAIDQVLRSGIGDVAAQGTNFGAYGGTPQAEMATQLGSRAAEAGAAKELETITQFGALETQRMQNIANTIQGLLGQAAAGGGTTTTDQTTATTGRSQQTGTTQTERTQEEQTQQARSGQETSRGTETGTQTTTGTQESEYDEIGGEDAPTSDLEDFVKGGINKVGDFFGSTFGW